MRYFGNLPVFWWVLWAVCWKVISHKVHYTNKFQVGKSAKGNLGSLANELALQVFRVLVLRWFGGQVSRSQRQFRCGATWKANIRSTVSKSVMIFQRFKIAAPDD